MQQAGSVRPQCVAPVSFKGKKHRREPDGRPTAVDVGCNVKAAPTRSKAKQRGIAGDKETSLRKAQLAKSPSEYWRDVQFTKIKDVGPDGDEIIYRFFHPEAFPPKADAAPMCRCAHCLAQWDGDDAIAVLTPPDYLKGAAVCVDHLPDHVNVAFGTSPSAKSITEAQRRNIKFEQHKIESEKKADLRKEIRQFIRRKRARSERA